MERLTKKEGVITQIDKDGNITKNDFIEVKDKDEAYKKLCQLEDIEQELGIELTTLYKISKQLNTKKEIWVINEEDEELSFIKLNRGEHVYYLIDFTIKAFVEMMNEPTLYLDFIDYKKTWALNREDLEQ